MINNNYSYETYPIYQFGTRTFSEIYSSLESFKSNISNSGIPLKIKESNLITLYYLLRGRFGNHPIGNYLSEENFKYSVQSTIFMYGPSWEKRLEIQDKLRSLTEDEILKGGGAIYNTSNAPGKATAELVDAEGKFNYISGQNTTAYRRSKMEGYSTLIGLLETDVTKEFIDRFAPLFAPILYNTEPVEYLTEV